MTKPRGRSPRTVILDESAARSVIIEEGLRGAGVSVYVVGRFDARLVRDGFYGPS